MGTSREGSRMYPSPLREDCVRLRDSKRSEGRKRSSVRLTVRTVGFTNSDMRYLKGRCDGWSEGLDSCAGAANLLADAKHPFNQQVRFLVRARKQEPTFQLDHRRLRQRGRHSRFDT